MEAPRTVLFLTSYIKTAYLQSKENQEERLDYHLSNRILLEEAQLHWLNQKRQKYHFNWINNTLSQKCILTLLGDPHVVWCVEYCTITVYSFMLCLAYAHAFLCIAEADTTNFTKWFNCGSWNNGEAYKQLISVNRSRYYFALLMKDKTKLRGASRRSHTLYPETCERHLTTVTGGSPHHCHEGLTNITGLNYLFKANINF